MRTASWRHLVANWVVLLTCCFISSAAHAEVLLLAWNNDAAPYQQTNTALRQSLSPRWQLHQDTGDGETSLPPNIDMAAAIGSDACRRLHLRHPDVPLLCLLLPRANFEDIMSTKMVTPSAQRTALYIDQPDARQLRLAHQLFPKLRRFSVFYSAHGPVPELLKQSHEGIQILPRPISKDDNLVRVLRDALAESDALLAIPDKQIYNQHSLRSILLTAYRAHKPLIGYARPFVKAGALMSLHSPPEALAKEAASWLNNWLSSKTKTLPAANYPRQYAIAINQNIARALTLDTDPNLYVNQLFTAQEGAP